MQHSVFSRISGLYPLDAIAFFPVVTTPNAFRHCQMSPGTRDRELAVSRMRLRKSWAIVYAEVSLTEIETLGEDKTLGEDLSFLLDRFCLKCL